MISLKQESNTSFKNIAHAFFLAILCFLYFQSASSHFFHIGHFQQWNKKPSSSLAIVCIHVWFASEC